MGLCESENSEKQQVIQNEALSNLFSIDSFFCSEKFGAYHIKLVTDDDLIFMMKQEIAENQENSNHNDMSSWLYRQHKLKPLWKSYPEFRVLFSEVAETKVKKFKEKDIDLILKEFIKKKEFKDCKYVIKEVISSFEEISEQEILIDMDGRITDFKDLKLPQKCKDKLSPFFYIYGDDCLRTNKDELIRELIKLARAY